MLKNFLSAIIFFFLYITNAHAVTPGNPGGGNLPKSEAEQFGGFTHSGLVGQIVGKILPVILILGGFITVIVIIISGIQFITSGGNPEAANAARGRLTYAIIGFVIIILAFAILQIVNKIFLGNTGLV